MLNVKVREDGYYLVKDREVDDFYGVARIANFGYGTEVLLAGTEIAFTIDEFYWIADEPLDLESTRLLMMNGGLENAVELVNQNASTTSSVQLLKRELKRYKDWYGDMDALSR